MTWVRKVVVAVKDIDTKGKIKLGTFGIATRSYINKEEDIISTNNRLEKNFKENEFFFIDDSNADATCFKKSKLSLNRVGAY